MLAIENLTTEIDSDSGLVRAVDSLSLAIERGETFALVGESGCGKSMTALSILRLLPDAGRVTTGSVEVEGNDILQLPEMRMRDIRGHRISIIFQEPATSLNPVMTVGRQIAEVIERHTPLRGDAALAKAVDWLKRVGIPEPQRRIGDYPFQMSGGQKQRVMIAIALAAEPDIVIADEPTTALDVTIQAQILDLLQELQASQKMAMLLITHDLAIVAKMAHRVALMYAGQVVEVADAKEFFANPLHPYAVNLFEALPDTGKRGRKLASISGSVPPLNQVFAGCRFADRCGDVMDRCRTTPPMLIEFQPRHSVRCLLYDGVDPSETVNRIFSKDPALPADPPAGDVVLDVRVPGLVPDSQGTAEADGRLRESRRRRFLQPSRGPDAGAGRRIGQRQDHRGKGLLQLLRNVATISGTATLEGQRWKRSMARRCARRVAPPGSCSRSIRLARSARCASMRSRGGRRPRCVPTSRRPTARSACAVLLEKVGLRRDALTRYPHEFSGGQRQRLADRPRACVSRPDRRRRATSALDVSVQAQILNLLKQLQQELGVAYLFITHNFGVVEYLAHDIAVMKNGKVVEAGPAERVLMHPEHEYTRALLAAVPRLDRQRPEVPVAAPSAPNTMGEGAAARPGPGSTTAAAPKDVGMSRFVLDSWSGPTAAGSRSCSPPCWCRRQ